MTRSRLVVATLTCFAVLTFAGSQFMDDTAPLDRCHHVEPAEWNELAANFQRQTITKPAAPFRDLEFVLDPPFYLKPDDILIFNAYADGRGIDHVVFDGNIPADGRIHARLAVAANSSAEVFWLGIRLLRPSTSTVCRWSLEERFELPPPPHASSWRIKLLPERVPTSDGGFRTTLVSPLD